jgi:hypothetical protein
MTLISKSIGRALAINSAGMVAGEISGRPFAWTAGKGLEWLPAPGNLGGGIATAVNDLGEISGQIQSECGAWEYDYYYNEYCISWLPRSVYWGTDHLPVDLRLESSSDITVTALNSSRQLAGTRKGGAFLRTTQGEYLDLGTLPRRAASAASAMNEAGMIVGSSTNP